MVTYTRAFADIFIQENKAQILSKYRLNYHLMSEYGWMNDPNGFIQYKGEYHLFYQHYPYKPVWGPMHWGHAVCSDMINWRYLPVAIAPDMEYDKGGCFSGSAIEKEGSLHLIYTGHVLTGPDKEHDYVQTQNLAISTDGITFNKWSDNPVIPLLEIPEGISKKDFRDPKVIERNGKYYMVLGSNDGAGNGLILLYSSEDLITWEFINVIAKSDGHMGDNWECPDIFSMGNRDVLIMSPQRVAAQGHDYHNLHSTMYMIGTFEAHQGSFQYEQYYPIDYGFDYYAPQTTLDDRGRRIMIGWMDMWESDMPTQEGHHWAGAMSLPREIILSGDQLLFRPIEEIMAYRNNPLSLENILLDGEQNMGEQGDSYEMQLVFEPRDAVELGVKLRVGEGEETVITYSTDDRLLSLNRDRAGIGPKGIRRTAIELVDGELALQIFVDRSSIEIFIQGGQKVMTARIYPGEESLGIIVFSKGRCMVKSLCKWDLMR